MILSYRSDETNARLDAALEALLEPIGFTKPSVSVFRDMLIRSLAGKVVLMDQEHYDGMCREVRRAYGSK